MLGRARLRVVLVDGGRPRNAAASRVASYLGLTGVTPDELLSAGRAALSAYDVTLETGDVLELHGHDAAAAGLFLLSDGARREWRARAVLLATGLRDELPSVPGVKELRGGDVVGCPHCHGWEVRDEALALVGFRDRPELGVARALLVSDWSEDVVLCTDAATRKPDEPLSLPGRTVRRYREPSPCMEQAGRPGASRRRGTRGPSRRMVGARGGSVAERRPVPSCAPRPGPR